MLALYTTVPLKCHFPGQCSHPSPNLVGAEEKRNFTRTVLTENVELRQEGCDWATLRLETTLSNSSLLNRFSVMLLLSSNFGRMTAMYPSVDGCSDFTDKELLQYFTSLLVGQLTCFPYGLHCTSRTNVFNVLTLKTFDEYADCATRCTSVEGRTHTWCPDVHKIMLMKKIYNYLSQQKSRRF